MYISCLITLRLDYNLITVLLEGSLVVALYDSRLDILFTSDQVQWLNMDSISTLCGWSCPPVAAAELIRSIAVPYIVHKESLKCAVVFKECTVIVIDNTCIVLF